MLTSLGDSTYNLALFVQVVSEKMFENNGHMQIYSPGPEQITTWDLFFTNINLLSIWSFAASFPPLNDFVTVFPIQTQRRPNLTLP